MTELDKFKRRLIRSVARLLMQERRPEDEVWEQLQKETGCDCKLLWKRMRALTIKKLKRLLMADDRPDQVAAVARMSTTDWLLFDLVLVHDKCDVIGREPPSSSKEDEKQLVVLFEMVQKYDIDALSGDRLAEAWTNLTLDYNSTGRQCSAMLLQRRWYQLQEAARFNFYKLWQNYRGNKGLWNKAREHTPTPLQAHIATKYPHVITRPFAEWEELIQNRKVILRQEFEQTMRAREKKNTVDDDKPDLVVIEPVIETIDLGVDSDEEGQTRTEDGKTKPKVESNNEASQESSNVTLPKIKQEPLHEEDGLCNVQILETTHLSVECINEDSLNSEVHESVEQNCETVQKRKQNLKLQMSNFIENSEAFEEQESVKVDSVDTPDDLIQKKADEYFKSKIKSVRNQVTAEEKKRIQIDQATVQNVDIDDESHDDVDDIIKQKADEFVKKGKRYDDVDNIIKQKADEFVKKGENYDVDVIIKQKADKFVKKRKNDDVDHIIKQKADEFVKKGENDDDVDDIIKQKADEFVKKADVKKADASKVDMKKLVQDVVDDFKLPAELSFVDDGIEFVDDGIEYVEEDEDDVEDAKGVPADIKMNAPDMDAVNIKPEISALLPKVEAEIDMAKKEEDQTENEEGSAKFDLKLLMDPVVYTTKLDDMIIFKGKSIDSIQQRELIESVLIESKPVSEKAIKSIKYEPLIQTDVYQTTEDNSCITTENLEDSNTMENIEDENVMEDGNTRETMKDNNTMENIEDDNTMENIEDNNTMENIEDEEDVDNIDIHCYESSTSIDISEELKVKPTSYLLQKPRSRSYNPIQLCKNPDFNTRLKRLTAGFFSSSRNRRLFSACKPMTIDLHKAFESKLIDGTLYLKPPGETVPQQIEEDTCAQSATVIPSAMPIQSLLGNSNKKLNFDELVARPAQVQTVDLTSRSTDEEIARNKVINLRDLSEIRRINQTLLTAEVPPIRVENRDNRPFTHAVQSQSSLPATVTKADNNKFSEDDELKIISVAGGQDLPIPVYEPSSTKTNLQPKKTLMCDIPVSRRGPRPKSPGAKQTKPVYTQMRRHVSIPWNSKRNYSAQNIDDGLITIDTLNRMISKLHGMECDYYLKKKKKTIWHVDRKSSTDVTFPNVANKKTARIHSGQKEPEMPKMDAAKDSVAQKTDGNEIQPEAQKADSDVIQPEAENKKERNTGKKQSEVDKEQPEANNSKNPRSYPRRYCCWAREKIIKMGTKSRMRCRHSCGLECYCCCRMDLNKVVSENRISIHPRLTKKGLIDVYRTLELSDDETAVIHLAHSVQETPIPTPKVRVLSNDGSPPLVSLNSSPEVIDTQQKIRVIPEAAVKNSSSGTLRVTSGSSSASTTTVSLEPQETNTQMTPAIRININFTQATTEPYIKVPAAQPVVTSNFISNPRNVDPTLILQQIAAVSPNIAPDTSVNKTIVPIPKPITEQKQIIIDASNVSSEKRNERLVFLNSRNMANKPKDSPIFLGKDKILLTTVKFPPNLNSDQPSNPEPLQPTLIPTLPVPEGVQLVLLPNGKLTYHIDPTVQLNQEQLAELPLILSTVQQQLNATYPQLTQTSENTVVNDVEPIVINDEPTSDDVENSVDPSIIQKPDKRSSKQKEPDIDFECTEINVNDMAAVGKQTVEQVTDVQNQVEITETQAESSIANAVQEQSDESVSNASLNNTDITKLNNSKDSNINNAAENKDNQTEKLSEGSASGRNLLSDLMEMSGISAEDATPVQECESQNVSVTNILPESKEVIPEMQMSTNNSSNLSELTPVTSLVELKYACAHQGKFFKLDFNTGVLVPINVCIKKHQKKSNPILAQPSASNGRTETIDLTDDIEPDNTSSPSPIKIQQSSVIAKPVKLFKSIRTLTPNLLKRKHNVYIMKRPGTVSRSMKHTRKQSIEKIEAKIDLVDSDAPMEEEYLVENSDSDSSQPRLTRIDTNVPSTDKKSDSGDSSDEEPLAMKFMRLRQYKNNTNRNTEEERDKETASNDARPRTSQNTSEDKPMEVSSLLVSEHLVSAESTTEEASSGSINMEIDEPQFIPFSEDMSENQEDCILGV